MPAATRKKTRRLTDAQLEEMLALTSHADSVELKLTVPDSERRSTVTPAWAWTPRGPDPPGVLLRHPRPGPQPAGGGRAGPPGPGPRRRHRGQAASDRPRPAPPSVRKAKTMVVEVDAMPGGYVCSASFKGSLGPGTAVKQVAAGDRAIRKLSSKAQRAFYTAHAPDGLELDHLAVLGPIYVLELKFAPKGFSRRLVAELWLYPDGERILELSTKCAPGEGFQVAAETRAFLAEKGVDLYGEQTKTKTALELFARNLQEQAVV